MADETAILDWGLDSDGDLDFSATDVSTVSGVEAVRQMIELAVSLWRGEWVWDEDAGIPYLEIIGQKHTPGAADRYFSSEIRKVRYVQRVDRVRTSFNSETREMRVRYSAISQFGIIAGEVSQ